MSTKLVGQALEGEASQKAYLRPPKIEVQGVSRSFAVRNGVVSALEGISLTVGEGEFVSIVGPSGCGKSTLLRVIAGLLRPSSGVVSLRHSDPVNPLSAMVFQEHGIYPWKTVESNVCFGLRARGISTETARVTARAWLERLGLGQFATAYPDTLSGGMRQRVAIARALALEPELLLMDEPFAALDSQLRQLLQEELLIICQEHRRTVLLITHSLAEAILLSDRILVMSARPGRL
ncbi:MAG: ABC transporter ATP-binding protein, partial [Actinomycetota bacterium]